MDYESIAYYLDLATTVVFVFFLLCLWYYILYFIVACIKVKRLPKNKKFTKFAVLIPARNESKVIRNILESLKQMKYPREFFDVFVIVETSDDPTVEIVKEFGFISVVRGDLTNRRTKGFALDDCYKYIKANDLKYDAYLIFDADNVINPDYLLLMNDVYGAGYQVGVGYRNFTNAKKNWICGCSATLFSFMNQFTSRGRSFFFDKATLTGTGYFLDSKVVDDCGGWIWNGMTEDVELTAYCYYHNIKMHYYPYAIYYDEQPEKYRILEKQHVRWVWGFFASKKKFKKAGKTYPTEHKVKRAISLFEYKVSIFPFLFLAVVMLLTFIAFLILATVATVSENGDLAWLYAHVFLSYSLLYLTFMFIAAFTLGIDNKNLKFGPVKCVVIVLTYMFFFFSFLLAFLDGLFHKKKRTSWKVIEHKGEISNKDAIEAKENATQGRKN